jgi:hypothetical protein
MNPRFLPVFAKYGALKTSLTVGCGRVAEWRDSLNQCCMMDVWTTVPALARQSSRRTHSMVQNCSLYGACFVRRAIRTAFSCTQVMDSSEIADQGERVNWWQLAARAQVMHKGGCHHLILCSTVNGTHIQTRVVLYADATPACTCCMTIELHNPINSQVNPPPPLTK